MNSVWSLHQKRTYTIEYLVDNPEFLCAGCGAFGYYQERLYANAFNLDNYIINIDATKLLSEKTARRTNSIPLRIHNNKLIVAMSDPLNIFNIEDIEMESGMKLEIVIATKKQIEVSIEKYMGRRSAEKAVEDFNKQNQIEEDLSLIDEESDTNVTNSPVVRLIDSLIRQALKMGASDIHIEPFETESGLDIE